MLKISTSQWEEDKYSTMRRFYSVLITGTAARRRLVRNGTEWREIILPKLRKTVVAAVNLARTVAGLSLFCEHVYSEKYHVFLQVCNSGLWALKLEKGTNMQLCRLVIFDLTMALTRFVAWETQNCGKAACWFEEFLFLPDSCQLWENRACSSPLNLLQRNMYFVFTEGKKRTFTFLSYFCRDVLPSYEDYISSSGAAHNERDLQSCCWKL